MRYLIWSIEHNGWWRENSLGYTAGVGPVEQAGAFTAEEAIEILCNCQPGQEIPVRQSVADHPTVMENLTRAAKIWKDENSF